MIRTEIVTHGKNQLLPHECDVLNEFLKDMAVRCPPCYIVGPAVLGPSIIKDTIYDPLFDPCSVDGGNFNSGMHLKEIVCLSEGDLFSL